MRGMNNGKARETLVQITSGAIYPGKTELLFHNLGLYGKSRNSNIFHLPGVSV